METQIAQQHTAASSVFATWVDLPRVYLKQVSLKNKVFLVSETW